MLAAADVMKSRREIPDMTERMAHPAAKRESHRGGLLSSPVPCHKLQKDTPWRDVSSRVCHAGDTMHIVTVNRSGAVMRRCSVNARAAVPIAAIALLAAPCFSPPLAAQASTPTGVIVAIVRDTSHAAIAGAELLLAGSTVHGFTDDAGTVRLAPVGAGPARLTVRRLGFRPATVDVTVSAGEPVSATVQLVQVAQQLQPVIVRGTASAYGDQMEGFYNRRSHRLGHFITRSDIEQAQPSRLTDMFRRIPGIRLGSTGLIQDAVRMRGETSCAPLVWIDGAPAAAAEFDIDAIVPESVEAIEVYSGLAEAPAQFMPPLDVKACGIIVIWSRHGEPGEKKPRDRVTPAQLADMVASARIYTADEVDIPAHRDTSARVAPVYPEALFLAGTGGSVRAEFVVDTTGDVAMDTFSAISSTNPLFTASVRRAVAGAQYVPAMLAGHRVRQVVHQPFTFVVERGKPGATPPQVH